MISSQVLYLLVRHLESKANGDQFTYIPEFCTPDDRRIDLMAVSNWASHSYSRTAYEIKVSRADFLNEVKNGKKTDAMLKYADHAYFVIPSGLVKPEEVPAGCGFIEVTQKGCSIKRRAPKSEIKLEDSRSLLCMLMVQAGRRRKIIETILATAGENEITVETLKKATDDAYWKGKKEGREAEEKNSKTVQSIREKKLESAIRVALGIGWYDLLPDDYHTRLKALNDHSPAGLEAFKGTVLADLKRLMEKLQ